MADRECTSVLCHGTLRAIVLFVGVTRLVRAARISSTAGLGSENVPKLTNSQIHMFTISLIGQKGGTGKTTVALGLAVAAARAGYATAIVDLDPQASAAKWKGRRADENPAVVPAQVPRLKQTMETARSGGVDFVFIDTAGRKDDSALSAARCSDLVLIPTRTSILEIETLPEVNDMLRLAGSPSAFVLLNCVHPSAGPRGITDTQGTIKDLFELNVCPIHICQRSAYAKAPT